MRRLALVLCLLLCAAPAHAAIAIVQAGGSAADSSDNATSPAVDTTGATLLIVTCSWYIGGSINVTVSDSKGNTWTSAAWFDSTNSGAQVFYVNSATPTVGSGHTFQCDGTGSFPVVTFVAASGSAATPLDQTNGNDTASSVEMLTSGSVTPTENGELIVSALAAVSDGASHAIGSSFTKHHSTDFNSGVTVGGGAGYLIQATAGAVNPQWTWTGASDAAAAIATFKAAAAGGGGSTGAGARRMFLLGVGGGQ